MKKEMANLFSKTLNMREKGTLSVTNLEKTLLHSSKQRRRLEDKAFDKLPLTSKNSSEFKIISPFYDRSKVCKAINCYCPFHKRIREEALKKYNIRSRKIFNSTLQSPNKNRQSNEEGAEQRLSHKQLSKNKQNNSLQNNPHQVKQNHRNPLDSYNCQFNDFLKQAKLLLLAKPHHAKINDHTIKSPVGEIFRYIYEHLDQDRPQIEQYIQGIEKDRDITNFYLERYEDLRRRRTSRERTKQMRLTANREAQKQIRSRDPSKSNTRKLERMRTLIARKTNKEKTQRPLLMEKLISCVKQGLEIEEEQINQMAVFNIEVFQQNCAHLKKKIDLLDFDTLQAIKEDIVEKLENSIIANLSEDENYSLKRQIVRELLGDIVKRMEKLEQQQQTDQEREQYDRISSSYSKLNSSRKGTSDFPCKRRNSKFQDIAKKTFFLEANQQDLPKQQKESQNGSNSITNRQNQSKGTNSSPRNFLNDKEDQNNEPQQYQDLPDVLKKNQSKLKLAKYRRLSHDGFSQKPFLTDEEFNIFIPKITVENFGDIGSRLDDLALQFGDKWKKIKQIERRISDLKMKKYIVFENDTLITAKRKIHMLKEMLKQQVFEGPLKDEIKEYVSLIEQFNMLKNRSWAERKLKNIMNLNNDDIDIGSSQAPTENYLQNALLGIFGNRNKLIYYDVFVTEFEDKEVNLQAQLFETIEKDLKLQNVRSMKLEKMKSRVASQKQQVEEVVVKKQGELIQKGLEDHYTSKFCYEKSINTLLKQTEVDEQSLYSPRKTDEVLSHFKYFDKIKFS